MKYRVCTTEAVTTTAITTSTSTKARSSVGAKSPTESELIAEWPLNARGDLLRVAIDFYRQTDLNCRRWWLDGNGELRPRKAGVSLSVKHLPRLD